MQRRIRNAVMATLIASGLAAFGGCQKALFPPDAPRTQFENHQIMRGRVAPVSEPDVFGNPQPALRARLSQRD